MQKFINGITPLNEDVLNPIVEKIESIVDEITIIKNLFNEFVNIFGNPITATEFDSSGLTAQQFDNKNLTAAQFDVIGRTILI